MWGGESGKSFWGLSEMSRRTATLERVALRAPMNYESFSPKRAREATRAEIPEKWGKITKFPSPVRPPKMEKIAPKKGQHCSEDTIFL